MALESVFWVCPVCKRANRQLVEEGCAAPTEAIPVSNPGDDLGTAFESCAEKLQDEGTNRAFPDRNTGRKRNIYGSDYAAYKDTDEAG